MFIATYCSRSGRYRFIGEVKLGRFTGLGLFLGQGRLLHLYQITVSTILWGSSLQFLWNHMDGSYNECG